MPSIKTGVKICGLSTPESVEASAKAGAEFAGFIFHEPSPRYVDADKAATLTNNLPFEIKKVAVFVNPTNELVETVMSKGTFDMIQLHGNETPKHVRELRNKYMRPVIKSISIAAEADLVLKDGYEDAADWLLFDARTDDPSMPGGKGQTFDWNILYELQHKKPWFLSGGLNVENIGDALSFIEPDALDVSSGVESEPGVKDLTKIKAFVNLAKSKG